VALVKAIGEAMGPSFRVVGVETLEEASEWVARNVEPKDLILTLGAGSITRLAGMLAERLI
jgi:UDP-N-acetylmuramate-alanine ligase